MALIQRLQAVNDRLSQLNAKFGDERYPVVILVSPQGLYIPLEPRPRVTEVDPRLIGKYLSAAVEIAQDDLVITGISRAYDKELVSKSKYLIKATQQPSGSWAGLKAEVISVDERQMMSYTVVVRRTRSR